MLFKSEVLVWIACLNDLREENKWQKLKIAKAYNRIQIKYGKVRFVYVVIKIWGGLQSSHLLWLHNNVDMIKRKWWHSTEHFSCQEYHTEPTEAAVGFFLSSRRYAAGLT